MLELTNSECDRLEQAVLEKFQSAVPEDKKNSANELYMVMLQTAIKATIATVREYERMKENPKFEP